MEATTTAREAEVLAKLLRRSGKISAREQQRLRVIYDHNVRGVNRLTTAATNGVSKPFVDRWSGRWRAAAPQRQAWAADHAAELGHDLTYGNFLLALVRDEPRSGTPPKYGPEVRQQVIALALTYPPDLGLPFERWSHQLLSQEVVRRGIAPEMSSTRVGDFLKGAPPSTPA